MRKASRTVSARIHRLTGQLEAIEAMLKRKSSCADVLHQISAVRAGIEQVAVIVFQTELQKLLARHKLNEAELSRLSQAFSKTT